MKLFIIQNHLNVCDINAYSLKLTNIFFLYTYLSLMNSLCEKYGTLLNVVFEMVGFNLCSSITHFKYSFIADGVFNFDADL